MEVEFDYKTKEYYIKEKIDGQIYCMAFQLPGDYTYHSTVGINIALYIISKRKNVDNIMLNDCIITGKNPFKSVAFAMRAFNSLEDYVVKDTKLKSHDKIIIYCTWLDNRRRDAYYKFLHKKGYKYGMYNGKKCILKEFTNETN